MRLLFLTTVAILGFAATNLSAQMTDMQWDTHGVGFKVPSNFVAETNNAEEFTASNDNLFLSIVPIQDEAVKDDDLAEAVVEMAKGLEYDVIEEAEALEVDDFTGYYVKGRKDGVNAVVIAVLDARSSTNLLVVIVYADGYENQAVDVAASLYAYD
ncbi:MAG: hypothetical protein SH848_20085 [Saprospiraceae bacterium]|nr:hypothetical protein [Saprospiraceae bacterium]MDZ4706239.1 hypothetical protein [Saprospiraceae bacterium]